MAMETSKLNTLEFDEFTRILGNVVERSPIIAGSVWSKRPFRDLDALHQEFGQTIDNLPPYMQVGLLRCISCLAGRLADLKLLSPESVLEQGSAGLLDMAVQEKKWLAQANAKYKAKFGFTFIICARLNKKEAIMAGIERRLSNTRQQEVEAALAEVKKIVYLRLCNIVKPRSRV